MTRKFDVLHLKFLIHYVSCDMKLLLTSSGITNRTIANAFFDLIGKRPEETTLAFIPTASNVEQGDKWWVIEDLNRLRELKLKSIDIVDISALSKTVWLPRLEESDILYFEGGNSYHLMGCIRSSGLEELLPSLLEQRLYVGVSAGSMITSKDLQLGLSQTLYEEDLDRGAEMRGLGYIDTFVLPHLNSEWFKHLRSEHMKGVIGNTENLYYAIDDQTALVVLDGTITVVGEGDHLLIT